MPEIGVLLVEDERFLDRVVSDALRTIGVPCETVSCEEEAVRRLAQRRYDLVILDLRILHGSGVAVLQQVRARDPELPVIVITAYTAAEDVMHALALGVDALLYKPFDIDTLLNTVRALLQKRVQVEATRTTAEIPSDAACELRWLQVGALPMLRSEAGARLGEVLHADEFFLTVRTAALEPPYPARWTVEWTGRDALYQFASRVARVVPREDEIVWVLRLPRLIRRIQRRRAPRLPVVGKAFISVAGRLQRAAEAEVVDLSEGGVCLVLTEPLMRGAPIHLEVSAQCKAGLLKFQFQGEGSVRSIVAFTQQGAPRYRVGVQLHEPPKAVVQQLRQWQRERPIPP